jgi:predicted nucleic acid-binding protein
VPMMPSDVFFDTNILIYLASGEPARFSTSDRLVRAGGVISVQVLNEIARVTSRKLNFNWVEVSEFLASIKAKCDIVPLRVATHELGVSYAERYKLGVYDAMIVAAAVLAGCTTLYSEAMHDGLLVDGLTVRNPFRTMGEP